MPRFIKNSCIIVVVVSAIGLAFYISYKPLIGKALPATTQNFLNIKDGTSINVGKMTLDAKKGQLDLKNLSVQNPKGYTDKNIASLESLSLHVDPASFGKEVLTIKHIRTQNLQLSYEKMDKITNFEALSSRFIETTSPQNEASPISPTAQKALKNQAEVLQPAIAKEDQKKIIIDRLEFGGGKVDLVTPIALLGDKKHIVLPEVTLQNLGTAEGGVVFANISKQFTDTLLDNMKIKREVLAPIITGTFKGVLMLPINVPIKVISAPVKVLKNIVPKQEQRAPQSEETTP